MTNEERLYKLNNQECRCAVCGKKIKVSEAQAAHRIADTIMNRTKYGSFFIDAPENLRLVCSLKCNDACNCGYNPGAVLDVLQEILDAKKRGF